MAYILKNSSGLNNTRFTDVGRQRLSEGKLDIRYFQIGDSEVSYGAIPGFDQVNNFILEAAYNAQNTTQEPETNKMHVKYPLFVKGSTGSTYGLAIAQPRIDSVYNTAAPRGFFQTGNTNPFTVLTSSAYTKNSNFIYNTCNPCGTDGVFGYDTVLPCELSGKTPSPGDIAVLFFDGSASCNQINGSFPILFYKITYVNNNIIKFDRDIPNYVSSLCDCKDVRILIYPSGMTELYDLPTPIGFWNPNVINFDSICYLSNIDVKIWNMNIVWSVSPAGFNPTFRDFTKFGSREFIGSKEYFGYQNNSGQTFFNTINNRSSSTDSYYYNSYDEKIFVEPYEQKAIAIVHYTNNAIDSYYGEKFAMKPFDSNAQVTTGFARNFKITIPWLMWHKSKTGVMGETFYVDPNINQTNYFELNYMRSSKNSDMNEPGLRYYHLWDTHLNDDGNPSRVGKVFPDLKQIVFDDDEIVAALSYKSNRNWTLPAPKLSLLVPNAFDNIPDDNGLLGDENEFLYVTYRFNSINFTDSLHSNYYPKIQGPQTCFTNQRQDVAVKFGDEFPFLTQCCFKGFNAEEFEILAQKVTGSTTQPNPSLWRKIDFTNQLSGSSINGFITSSGLTSNTFIIRDNMYNNAPIYNLNDHIKLPLPSETNKLNFGDEYFFYGNVETDIEATIYEMVYLINLAQTQFTNSSNPTWSVGTTPLLTEIGLFDVNKDLVVITKLQSPTKREFTQQFAVRLDF